MGVKVPIILTSSHIFDSSGGFFWDKATPRAREGHAELFAADVATGFFDEIVTLELSVAWPESGDPDEITDYLDGAILDSIESAQIGRVVAHYQRPNMGQEEGAV